jgi:polyphosphate kinase
MEKIEKGLKNRRKGKFVRFIYDKEMDVDLLEFLIKGLSLAKKGTIIPGGRIHNFRHFMDFPDVFTRKGQRKKPFPHPLVGRSSRITGCNVAFSLSFVQYGDRHVTGSGY